MNILLTVFCYIVYYFTIIISVIVESIMNKRQRLSDNTPHGKSVKKQSIDLTSDNDVLCVTRPGSNKQANTTIASIKHKKTFGSNNWQKFLELQAPKDKLNNKPKANLNVNKHTSQVEDNYKLNFLSASSNMNKLKTNCISSTENLNTANYSRPVPSKGDIVETARPKFKHKVFDNERSQRPKHSPSCNTLHVERNCLTKHEKNNRSEPKLTKLVALDCEMVGVEVGVNHSALARVSIVNANEECVYDKFVKPTEPVLDYRTHVSGVRPCDLKDAEDFKTVQTEVADIIKGRILIGHALNNDLKVLFLTHPRYLIRDTSKFKKFSEGKKPSLKKLAMKYLGVTIQEGEHSSIQDALAAMQLYRMFRKEWEASIVSKRVSKPKVQNDKTKGQSPFSTLTASKLTDDI